MVLSEEGHMYDHEPGRADYHEDHLYNPEFEAHQEYYAKAHYPVFLEHDAADEHMMHNGEENDTESNLYHSWPIYTPIVSHYQDEDEYDHRRNGAKPATATEAKKAEVGKLDFVAGLRRMSFEGLKDKDRATDKVKAARSTQQCYCHFGTEACCAFSPHEAELEHFEAPQTGHPFRQAHYCITGDEPQCDILRQEEEAD